jgi:hypothetical protein
MDRARAHAAQLHASIGEAAEREGRLQAELDAAQAAAALRGAELEDAARQLAGALEGAQREREAHAQVRGASCFECMLLAWLVRPVLANLGAGRNAVCAPVPCMAVLSGAHAAPLFHRGPCGPCGCQGDMGLFMSVLALLHLTLVYTCDDLGGSESFGLTAAFPPPCLCACPRCAVRCCLPGMRASGSCRVAWTLWPRPVRSQRECTRGI